MSRARVVAEAFLDGCITSREMRSLLRPPDPNSALPVIDQAIDPDPHFRPELSVAENQSDLELEPAFLDRADDGDLFVRSEDPDFYERRNLPNQPLPAPYANFIYAGKYLSSPASRGVVSLDIELATITSGNAFTATPPAVFRLIDGISQKYDVETSYFCGKCYFPLLTQTSRCLFCSTSADRTLEFKPFGVATSNLLSQLYDILEANLDFFQNLPAPSSVNRSELHFWHEQQHHDTILLHLIVNTDGVSPKQNFQGELNPVYFAIGNLPAHRRGLLKNVACASIISGRGKPTNEIWGHVITCLDKQLNVLRSTGITVGGLTFKLSHLDVNCDIMAANDIFSSVGHCSTDCGCLQCLEVPKRKGHTSCWATVRQVPDRSPDSYRVDAINRQNGLKGLTVWYKLQNPSEWRVEGLHTIDKGVIMTFKEIYVRTKVQVRKWNKVFINGRFPDSTVFRPRTLKQAKRFTANDNRSLYFTLMPIIWFSLRVKQSTKSALSFLTFLCIRHMASRYLDANTIEIIIKTLRFVGKKIDSVFPSKFRQMKSHLLFVHVIKDLMTRGTPYDHTAAPFEALNRVIKVRYHPYDTRSLTGSILTNFLAWREWCRKAQRYLEDPHIDDNFAKALKKLVPKKRIRKRRFSAVKEGGTFDNSVVRYTVSNKVQYGRIIEVNPKNIF